MRTFWLLPAILLALASIPDPGRSAWGPSGCYAQPAAVAVNAPSGWFESADYPGWQVKRDRGRAVEWYEPATGQYMVLVPGGKWEWRTPPASWRPELIGAPRVKCCACSKDCGCKCECNCKTKGKCNKSCTCEPKRVAGGFGQKDSKGNPQVDVEAVLRLGSMVQHVDGTFRDGPDELFAQAMAPPPDDSHKWFISVITMQGCGACAKLKADWRTSPDLRALARPDPAEQKESWAHFNSYDRDDKSQQWRWANLKVSGFPTILVQPPRTGQYGDPKTVVYQGTYGGDPRKLADGIRDAIKRYLARLPRQSSEPAPSPREVGLADVEAVAQKVGVDPPWKPAPKVDPPVNPSILPPDPNDHVKIPPDDVPAPLNPASWSWKTLLAVGCAGLALLLLLPHITPAVKAAMERAKQGPGPMTLQIIEPPAAVMGTKAPSLAEHFAAEAAERRRRREEEARTDAAMRDYLDAGVESVRKPDDPPPLPSRPI